MALRILWVYLRVGIPRVYLRVVIPRVYLRVYMGIPGCNGGYSRVYNGGYSVCNSPSCSPVINVQEPATERSAAQGMRECAQR